MGAKAGSAIRARQREVEARVERLIARADERDPIGSARRTAVKDAVSDGRRALRARDRGRESVASAEAELGSALLRIVAQGLTRAQSFEALGLSTAFGRRLYLDAESAAARPTATSSTGALPDVPSSG